jgi:formylglycine-generating enzyme required for sulfatase activity
MLRGGSWFNDVDDARTSNRYYFNPSNRSNDIGFRCAR